MSGAWGGSAQSAPAMHPGLGYGQVGHGVLDNESRVPVINLKDGTRLAGDDAPKKKDLEQWLREHPGFVADVGAFIPGIGKMQFQDGRPKQKRHRCRNPNKIDVNSLTGEERVQIINRRNARKVGGAFAPPLKDLGRFLLENPEYGVPPEWADVVKQSGYLPESMFDRILTGPIVPEEVSRRGRRPKNAAAKAAVRGSAAAAASLALNPLLANGLLSGMDLSSLQALQQNLQSLQSLQLTAGLMGLPGGLPDANNLATMFPMMLSGMAGLPNPVGAGGPPAKAQEDAAATEDGKKNRGASGDGNPPVLEGSSPNVAPQGKRTEGQGPTDSSITSSITATAAPSASTTPAASTRPLALNPLLLSSMLYPGMLLTPGLNLPTSTLSQPTASDTQPQGARTDPEALPATAEHIPEAAGEEEEGSEREEEESREEPKGQKENSGTEGSGKAESSSSSSSSSSSDRSSSSSEDSDSSDED